MSLRRGAPLRLLVVEDNPADADLVREKLRAAAPWDCLIEHVTTLEAALSAHRRVRPEVVLLDLGLPDARGTEAVATLRTAWPEVPIVVLTGRAGGADLEAAERGADGYVSKDDPDPRVLARAVLYAVERSRAHRQLRALVERSPDGILVVEQDGTVRLVNEAAERLFGQPRETLARRGLRFAVGPAESCTIEVLRPDGSRRLAEVRVSPMDWAGTPAQVVTLRDETERITQRAWVEALLDAAPDALVVADGEGRVLRASRRTVEILGRDPGSLIGLSLDELLPPPEPDAGREPATAWMERPDGTRFPADVRESPMHTPAGPHRVVAVRDLSERWAYESALRESESRVRAVLAAMPDLVAILGADGRVLEVVDGQAGSALRAAGVVPGAGALAAPLGGWIAEHVGRALATGSLQAAEVELAPEGDVRWIEGRFAPMAGERVLMVARDVTARRRARQAEQALRESELQLQQMQKMEAVGQLAGGIAHDFNNLLTCILSFAGLVRDSLPPGDPRLADLREVLDAGNRAALLTRQLLAFSRRQPPEAAEVDVGGVLEAMDRLLRRTLGSHIEISIGPVESGSLVVRCCAGQLDQVLLNLALNARDAMPRGGKLEITAGLTVLEGARAPVGLAPGRYARIEVRDTGSGMDAKTAARVFEPFFTTKRPGEGTGLGLSMCYGIVRQWGGHITVESEPGEGTTFRVLLPAAEPGGEAARPSRPCSRAPRPTVTVVVADDDARVRRLATRALERAGYRVLGAENGPEALALLERRGAEVGLMLIEETMPELAPAELVDQARAAVPGLRLLWTSNRAVESTEAVLRKPYTAEALLSSVRRALDAGPGGAARS